MGGLGIFLLIVAILLAIIIAFFLFWKLYFLRDPERDIPKGNVLVSPADGKVMKAIKYDISKGEIVSIPKGLVGGIKTTLEDVSTKGYLVSIFMSPMDVHVNRSPMSGKIIFQKHTKGKFHVASDFERSIIENEKNEVIIQDGKTKVKVIQIAGFVARRIESFVRVGQKLDKGQRFGRINLGSQLTMIFPENFSLNIKEGQRVYAGSSIIAEVRKK